MQEAVPAGGGMLAVAAREAAAGAVERCLHGLPVDVACCNAPGHLVLSGLADDLRAARDRLGREPATRAARFRTLPVSAPFHSRLMAGVEPGFREVLDAASAGWACPPAARVTCNVTGGLHDGRRAAVVERLVRQLSGRVRWVDNMRCLMALHPSRVVEIGPTSPLRGFFAVLRQRVEAITTVAGARHALERGA
jgi:malonyl CoA-acyl carrier protein transacylase